jgi:hypothetical protein
MQIGYSFGLKNIPVIDILIIAAGFILRVYAGAFVIDAHLSVWFLLCVISSALFLAAGKRRAELGVVGVSGETRKSLSKYSTELLNTYVTMFGNSAWMKMDAPSGRGKSRPLRRHMQKRTDEPGDQRERNASERLQRKRIWKVNQRKVINEHRNDRYHFYPKRVHRRTIPLYYARYTSVNGAFFVHGRKKRRLGCKKLKIL